MNLLEKTPTEITKGIAKRMAAVRKRRGLSQVELAKKSGVSYGSVKRFERTGEISLLSLTKIAVALSAEQDFDALFNDVPFLSMEELMRAEAGVRNG